MITVPPLRWQALRLVKQGNAAADYEDAAAADAARGRFAIADGASEASFAALWARLLVTRFVAEHCRPWRHLDWVAPLREHWAGAVDGLSLPWYAEDKRALGAFATFLGLALGRRSGRAAGTWQALAIGDSCLFHTRGDRLLCAFPVSRSADFGNRPRLLGSRSALDRLDEPRERARGKWKPADRLLLMTDALAHWFLLRTEQGKSPLAEIRDLLAAPSPHDAFAGWTDERRRHALLRNDDVTLVVVDLDAA